MIKVEAIVDGGMIGGNPGKGGWGGCFRTYEDDNLIDEKFFGGSFGEEIVTNNVCEWRALVGAMQIFVEHYWFANTYQIVSDSKLVVQQSKYIWNCKNSHLHRLRLVFKSLAFILPNCNVKVIHKRREHTVVAHDYIAKILGRTK